MADPRGALCPQLCVGTGPAKPRTSSLGGLFPGTEKERSPGLCFDSGVSFALCDGKPRSGSLFSLRDTQPCNSGLRACYLVPDKEEPLHFGARCTGMAWCLPC